MGNSLRRFAFLGLAAAGLCGELATPLRAADFKPDVQYVQVGDVKLAYYVRGEGKPLVMINGFVSTMSLWDPLLIEELAKTHKLVLFDNRGVGLSTDTQENNTTIPQMADDAAALIKALGLGKPDVLGWSMGARIAQQLLIRHPELVGKAVLAAPNPGGSHNVPADKDVEDKLNDPNIPIDQKLSLLAPGPDGVQVARELYDRILAAAEAGTAPDDFNVTKETTERLNRARTTLWYADEENYNDLKTITNPVLVTDGRDDVIDKPVNSLIIANQIPFSWLAFYDGGHAFLFQDYKRFAATVEAFLK
ncbi:MAG: alpha/beta hydrolase [Hyphomicrobiales bacterium]